MFAELEVILLLYSITNQNGVILVKKVSNCAGKGGNVWRERMTPCCSHWATEGLSIISSVWQTEISDGFQNALEGMFVRLQVCSFQRY